MYLFVLGFFHRYAILTGVKTVDQFSCQVNCKSLFSFLSFGDTRQFSREKMITLFAYA